MTNTSILLKDKTLSGACISSQSGPVSDGDKGVPCIPQSSSINGASSLDCSVSNQGHLFAGGGILLPLCRDTVGVFYSTSQIRPVDTG